MYFGTGLGKTFVVISFVGLHQLSKWKVTSSKENMELTVHKLTNKAN